MSRTSSLSREQRGLGRKTKIGPEVAHATRDSDSTSVGHGEAVDALSSCSSLSSVHSSSASDVDHHDARLATHSVQQPRRSIDRMIANSDTLDSGGPTGRVGENVYSRIKEPGSDFRANSSLI